MSIISHQHHALRLAWIVVLALFPSTAVAQNWRVLTDDFAEQLIVPRAIDSTSIVGTNTRAEPTTIPWSKVVRVESTQTVKAPAGRFVLKLRNGEAIAGEPGGLIDETLTWRSTLLGDWPVSLADVQSIDHPADDARPAPGEAVTEDTVFLSNGDLLRGIVSQITGSTLTVTASESTEVPWASVARLELASTTAVTTPTATESAAVEVSLVDGSRVRVKSVALADDVWKIFTIAGQQKLIDRAGISAIERLDGPVRWLSNLPLLESVQTPYLGAAQPAKMDASVNGSALRFGGQTFSRGIGVHSYSRLTWALDSGTQAVRFRYAVDGDLPYADMTVRVLLDDKIAYEQPHVRAGVISDAVKVEVGQAKRLSLEVDMGDGYDIQDRLIWIEPALIVAQ